MQYGLIKIVMMLVVVALCSCSGGAKKANTLQPFKGLYSCGPELKTFKDCDGIHEYWVTDNSAQLELKYSQMNFEKPYEPVYVEVEGTKIVSGSEGMGSEYDSTLVVKRVLKITKEIPPELCN
jgi:hypothetical protein